MSPPACGSKPVSAVGKATRSTFWASGCAPATDARQKPAATMARRCSFISEKLLDVAGDRCRLRVGRIALDHLAVAIDEELGEVPLDGLGAEQPGLRLLEIAVHRRGGVAVHVHLR